MARSKNTYSGCITGFLVTVIIGSVILTWFKDEAVSVWTTISDFFVTALEKTSGHEMMIAEGIIVVVSVWILIELILYLIAEKKDARDIRNNLEQKNQQAGAQDKTAGHHSLDNGDSDEGKPRLSSTIENVFQ